MLILGIDTATKTASAAVADFESPAPLVKGGSDEVAGVCGVVLAEITSNGALSHSENLMPIIDYSLKCAGVCLNDIDLFAVANGPGSFTGIRIGVAAIKGLAFGSEEDNCIGVSSLYSLAYNFYGFDSENILILPVIDARRKQVYNAVIDISEKLNFRYIKQDRIITLSELEAELNSEFSGRKIIFTGDAADMCYEEINFSGKINIPEILKKPSASALCRAAFEEYKKGGLIHPRILSPSYLIKTQAEREYTEKKLGK
ncbi:MAG: tRNA (adenosine(37)-N6)-threonylcarbamoyltransferase complex dimerization subunit type 1 TsaB [Oscillospiraceae bacterium]|nr:tRNA (adenosine(37)-N6)-threonylcarbamoyltransferase complex dimerization subunit type 1 TsaB [Oscillospiraceae bacterium]